MNRKVTWTRLITVTRPFLLIGLLASTAGCGNSSNGDATSSGGGTQGATQTAVGPTAGASTTNAVTSGGQTTAAGTTLGSPNTTGSATTQTTTTGDTSGTGSTSTGGATIDGTTTDGTTTGSGTGGATGSGGASTTTGGSGGGQTSGGGVGGTGGIVPSNCVGDEWPTANPTSPGPFQVAAEKNVGPLAGVVPDPIYGDEQQRFNVYHPNNLADSGYCHPILIWANGYRDNPEQNPPDCIVDSGANRWCGQYLPMLEHLASHGFVVVAPLSTATAEGDPLPTIAGLDWILEQAEDSSSPYYHRLDTENIGQLGHSYGGMSTCMSASEPRYRALATICGTRELSGVHTPMLFFCGGNDETVECDGVREVFRTVTDQPAFFINELNSDHGSWVYQGAGGVSLSVAAAWFRVHLMGDTANRKYFYGPDCEFCTDNRAEVEQNSLMAE